MRRRQSRMSGAEGGQPARGPAADADIAGSRPEVAGSCTSLAPMRCQALTSRASSRFGGEKVD